MALETLALVIVSTAILASTVWPYRKPAVFMISAVLLTSLLGINVEELVDPRLLEVLVITFALLIISGLLRYSNFFEFVTTKVSSRVNTPLAMFLAINLTAALLSAVAATSLVLLYMVTVTIELAVRHKVNPKPLLLSMLISSNVASMATMVGDLSNIIIATCVGFSYSYFLYKMGLIAFIDLIIVLIPLYMAFKDQLEVPSEISEVSWDYYKLSFSSAILTMFLGLSIVSGFFKASEASIMAAIAVAILFIGGEKMKEIYEKIEWEVILYLGALLLTMRAFSHSGAPGLVPLKQIDPITSFMISLGLSAFIDDAEAASLAISLLRDVNLSESVWWGFVMGTSLGSAISPLGSIANLIALRRANRLGIPITFLDYVKVSVPSVAIATLASLLALAGGLI